MKGMYVDYTGIRVTDLDRALRFFTRGLRLKEVRRGTMHHGGVWVLLRDPRSKQHLELNWYPAGSEFATRFVAGEGLDHIGVRTGDLPAVARRLRAEGARLQTQFKDGRRIVVAYYVGPDGIWIELIRQ
ncbi:MAG: VOC family protein [Thermoplasmata archaeon]|jgi:catechol 2,3-dioxygenase-like lactoylglutathione lyase family enzyme